MYDGCPILFIVDGCTASGHPFVFEDIEVTSEHLLDYKNYLIKIKTLKKK